MATDRENKVTTLKCFFANLRYESRMWKYGLSDSHNVHHRVDPTANMTVNVIHLQGSYRRLIGARAGISYSLPDALRHVSNLRSAVRLQRADLRRARHNFHAHE